MRRLIPCTYDSFTRQDNAGTNYRDEKFLSLRSDASAERYAWLYFALPDLRDATILSATLTVYAKNSWSGSKTLTARRVTEEWKEGQIKWNNQPTTTATGAAQTTVSGAVDEQAIVFDLEDIVQTWADAPRNVFGVRIHTDSTTLHRIYASEAAIRGRRPTLFIEWTTPPDAPTNLRPNGEDKAISEAAPRLLWESEKPYETQVQIDNVEDFSGGIIWDSGWVANDETSYDTALDGSPPSLTNNTTYWWRVRIRDANGVASDWSNAAEFDRATKGTLTITSPASNGDDVSTTTPLIDWTFTGRTQAEVEIELYEDGELTYTRPRFPLAATEFEIPPNQIRSPSSTYEVKVKVWDTLRRMTIGNDKSWVEASRTFDFAPTAGVTGVSNFDAALDGPGVTMTWTRASAPDYFALRVDDTFERVRLDPADLSTGGTGYEYTWYGSDPGEAHTYSIEAVVNTSGVMKHSSTNPSETLTFTTTGVWLVDPEDGLAVHIAGQEAVGGDLGEEEEVYYPLNSRAPVRIRMARRGWEGSLDGQLVTWDDQTAAEARDALETLKGRDRELRMVGAWRNFPVQLGHVALEPAPTPEETYNVSIEYEQTDEFSVRAH
jgi:hypothetical protein